MAAKKIASSPLIPFFLLMVVLFWPCLQTLAAVAYLRLTPLVIDSSDLSGPRQIQRYFQSFGVPLELNSIDFFQQKNLYKVNLPLGLNLPFTGRMESSVEIEIKST